MSADISNVVELQLAAEEWPIDVVVLLRGAVGALASSYLLEYDLYGENIPRAVFWIFGRRAWPLFIIHHHPEK